MAFTMRLPTCAPLTEPAQSTSLTEPLSASSRLVSGSCERSTITVSASMSLRCLSFVVITTP